MSSKVLSAQAPVGRPQSLASKALLAAALALAALGVACGGNSAQGGQSKDPPPVAVKLEVARAVAVSDTTEYVATLKSRDSAVIMPEVEGRITEIYVHSGNHISAGVPLMQIDPRKQQAAVNSQEHTRAAQEANLAYAQQQYERSSRLYAAGVVSKQDFDQSKSALDAAQAQLRSLDAQVNEQQVQLHYYRVVAPWNGIVGDIPVRVGDRVITSTTLTTVDKPGSLEVYILGGADQVIAESRISFISPEVDNTTQTVLVKARIAKNSDKLRTSQFIRVRVVWGMHLGPVVPVLAVSRVGGQYFAFVAEDQNGKLVARQKALRLGEMTGNDYVVLEGIKAGDKVIVSGTQFLLDGAPVVPQG